MGIIKRKCPYCRRYHFNPKGTTCATCQKKLEESLAAYKDDEVFFKEEEGWLIDRDQPT